ncbi:MAG: flagellin N-terminal helical domain-containing protein [Planctomycetota bacterium]|jgi:flagellin
MSRINTNIPALTAQHDLARAQKSLTTSLRRLSSGIRINTASEDPAGLIISELLRSEIVSIGRAISNTQRAVNIIATTEGALNEVNSLLVDIRDKLVGAASTGALSEEEINANQLQIDSAVRSIARIANSTSFGGRTLLNGNLDYVYSGIDGSNVAAVTVYAAQFAAASNIKVIVDVTNTASAAKIGYATSGLVASGATIEISGVKGSEVLVFGGSAATSAIVFAVNAVTEVTGVSAALSGNTLALMSDDVGSDQFVSVNVLAGAFSTTALRDEGADAAATVNGASVDAQGNALMVNQLTLQATIDLDSGAAVGASTFYVTGGGALFQIGQNVNFGGQYNIGIQSANPARLGRAGIGWLNQVATGGAYSLENGGAGTATLIVSEAILAVSTQRGRLGALQRNTFETNIASLRVALENVTAAESDIRDTDFAKETAALTRAEILVQAGTSILQTANMIPQNVLALLGR